MEDKITLYNSSYQCFHCSGTSSKPPVTPKCQTKVVAYKILDHTVCLISICRDLPSVLDAIIIRNVNSCTFDGDMSVSRTTEECDMVTTPLILFHLRAMSSGRLREVENKKKFRTFSSKSARGYLREAVAFEMFQM